LFGASVANCPDEGAYEEAAETLVRFWSG